MGDEQCWFVRKNGKTHGPFTARQLKQLAEHRKLLSDDEVRKGESGEWLRAEKVKGLFPRAVTITAAQSTEWAPAAPDKWPPLPASNSLPAAYDGQLATTNAVLDAPPIAPSPRQHIASTAARVGEWSRPQKSILLIAGCALIAGGFTLFAVVAVLGLLLFRGTSSNMEKIVARAEPSVAFIKGRFSSGTGFVFRPGVIATNKHVISMELIDHLQIRFPSAKDSGPFSAELIYEDPDRDLAFLSVRSKAAALSVARQHAFRRGEEVIVIGNPGVTDEVVLKNAVSRGVVSTETTINGHDYYQLGISINGGNSGGPVLNSTGQVIGIVTLKASEKEGIGFCIPLNDLDVAGKKMDQLSSSDTASIRSRHRLRVAYIRVGAMAELYRTGMGAYAEAMETAIQNRRTADSGLQSVRGEIQKKLDEVDSALMSSVEKEAVKITGDKNLPDGMRERFVDLWTNYLELKSYVDNPRGSLITYQAKYHELSDRHNRFAGALKLLLAEE
jgi:S1-C subfamily serine protease